MVSKPLPHSAVVDDETPDSQVDSWALLSDRPLLGDLAFHGLVATQFLGAFNDNLFKQVVLLLFIAVPIGGVSRDLQPLAMLLFALPFVMFSGYAGYLSDRHGKQRVIVLSKVAEIVVMGLGLICFCVHGYSGMTLPLVIGLGSVLFCMGAQSAFFGPGKYGILPELFRQRDLPAANGIILMTTFVAIILGVGLAGILKQQVGDRLWLVGVCCVIIAIVGTLTSLVLRKPPAADRSLPFQGIDTLTIPRDMVAALRGDRPLLAAVVVYSVFWMCAAVVQPATNDYGLTQLRQGEARTSLMLAGVSMGIAVGSVATGYMSRGQVAWRMLRGGLAGMSACLVFLAWFGGAEGTRDGLIAGGALVLLGFFTGMFAVPIQVFLQERPPHELKGRMIATANFLNWIGILVAAAVYAAIKQLQIWWGWPPSYSFGLTALPLVILLFVYRPRKLLKEATFDPAN